MKKEIMYTEIAPEKKFLWLHHKGDDLVLEGFGNNGWESVGQEQTIDTAAIATEVAKKIEVPTKAVKIRLPKLTEECSKKDLLVTIEKLKNALVKAGIIEI